MKTIEEMARKAGFDIIKGEGIYSVDEGGYDARNCERNLVAFAALVRADERERCFFAIVGDLPKDGPSSDYEITMRRAAEKVRLLLDGPTP